MYIELHSRSAFSFLEGSSNPETLGLGLDNQGGVTVPLDISKIGGGSLPARIVARDQHFKDHARHGLFAPLDSAPVSV